MSQLTKREHVEAALKGAAVDRVPVSAWQHFLPAERQPETLAAASLKHFHDFDWDWLKVNPRATYYAEAWGSRYNFDQYTSVLPKLEASPLQIPADLEKIREVSGTEGVFAEQLKLIQLIKAGIGGAHFIQTVFSPLSVLYFLVARPQNKPLTLDEQAEAQYSDLRRCWRPSASASCSTNPRNSSFRPTRNPFPARCPPPDTRLVGSASARPTC